MQSYRGCIHNRRRSLSPRDARKHRDARDGLVVLFQWCRCAAPETISKLHRQWLTTPAPSLSTQPVPREISAKTKTRTAPACPCPLPRTHSQAWPPASPAASSWSPCPPSSSGPAASSDPAALLTTHCIPSIVGARCRSSAFSMQLPPLQCSYVSNSSLVFFEACVF